MIVREINKSARTSANYKYFNGLKHFAASDVELRYRHRHFKGWRGIWGSSGGGCGSKGIAMCDPFQ